MKRMIQLLSLFSFTASLFGEIKEVVIVGGGPAGLTAALYSGRAGLSTLVIEGDEPSGQIALSYNVENYPGFPKGISGFELGREFHKQAVRFGAVIVSDTVTDIDLSSCPFRLKLRGGSEVYAKSLIIASGARTRWLGIPSEEALKNKGVNSCAVCDGFLYRGKEVVVVGGGDAALDDALYLANLASKVTVVHRRDQLRASKILQNAAFSNPKIRFIYDTTIEEIVDVSKGSVEGVRLKNQVTGDSYLYPCQAVFVAIGHIPNTELFKGQLDLDEGGYIRVEPFSTKTSISGVFAAGDVADPHYRQAVIAAGSGSMAAIDAFQFIQQETHNKKETL